MMTTFFQQPRRKVLIDPVIFRQQNTQASRGIAFLSKRGASDQRLESWLLLGLQHAEDRFAQLVLTYGLNQAGCDSQLSVSCQIALSPPGGQHHDRRSYAFWCPLDL